MMKKKKHLVDCLPLQIFSQECLAAFNREGTRNQGRESRDGMRQRFTHGQCLRPQMPGICHFLIC